MHGYPVLYSTNGGLGCHGRRRLRLLQAWPGGKIGGGGGGRISSYAGLPGSILARLAGWYNAGGNRK